MAKLEIPEQMKQRTLWAVWILLMGSAAMWLLVGSVSYWVKHGWLPSNADGWVQAVGSVVAILVAVLIAARQGQLQAETVKNQEAELLKRVLAVAKHAGTVAHNSVAFMNDGHNKPADLGLFVGALDNCDYLLKQISYDRIPGAEASLGWIELRHAVADVRKHAASIIAAPVFGAAETLLAELARDRVVAAVRRIESSAVVHLPELNISG